MTDLHDRTVDQGRQSWIEPMVAQHDERVLERLVHLAQVKERWLLKDFR